jgi:TetR/AcrR family transcriptional regulator
MDNAIIHETERKILEAARKVFISKGMHGARMQEIADEAGINKALLHYYFRSKDKLFQAIFRETFEELMPKAIGIFKEEGMFEDKLRLFVSNYIDTISKNHFLPVFVFNEINQNPEMLTEFVDALKPLQQVVAAELQKKVASGEYSTINPVQFFSNVMAMTLFPFLAKPLLTNSFAMSEEQFKAFVEQRKVLIPEIMLTYLKTVK